MVNIDPKEAVFERILGLDPVQPFYFSYLFSYTRLILPKEDIQKLNKKIKDIENMLGSDIYTILVTLETDSDLTSFIKREIFTGSSVYYIRVTRFDIMKELENIRVWIFGRLRELQQYIRFQRVKI